MESNMSKSSRSSSSGKSTMNTTAAARIMSSTAKAGNGQIKAGNFPARAQAAAAQTANGAPAPQKS